MKKPKKSSNWNALLLVETIKVSWNINPTVGYVNTTKKKHPQQTIPSTKPCHQQNGLYGTLQQHRQRKKTTHSTKRTSNNYLESLIFWHPFLINKNNQSKIQAHKKMRNTWMNEEIHKQLKSSNIVQAYTHLYNARYTKTNEQYNECKQNNTINQFEHYQWRSHKNIIQRKKRRK